MRLISFFVLLSLAAAGCAPAATQLVVVVDTDLAVPSELDEIRVTVSGPEGVMETEMQGVSSRAALPLTLAVIAAGENLGPIDVVAEGRLDGAVRVSRRARVTLVRGESRMLVIDLLASCVGVSCSSGMTCSRSGCTGVTVTDLPPWTGVLPGSDAGVDAPRFDARLPDGGDGGVIDAGGPCETDDDCDDGVACTTETCGATGCLYMTDSSACDDDNPCTDDVCTPGIGCANPANTATCSDGVFCNGFDSCSGGACAMHAGNPCTGATVCDEASGACTGCTTNADCPADTTGTWSACDYADGCDQSATRTRTNRTYACMSGACVATDTPESEACTRTTNGMSCGEGSCGSYGACDYTTACDQSANATRTCTDLTCSGGVCRPSNRDETMPCTRSTNGTSCGATSCGSYGACDYSDACDTAASRSRTCNDMVCASGSCGMSPRTETEACTRSTNGTSCGMTSCGSYGACDYSSVCDESANQSRTCTDPVCGSGSCGSSMRTENRACTRSTTGTSCGSGMACMGGSCVSCTPTLSGGFGDASMQSLVRVMGSGNTLRFYDNAATPASGTVTASSPVTFSGNFVASNCIGHVIGMGSTIRFLDNYGGNMGDITVSGATVSGTANPPCFDIGPYGCFPMCAGRVQAVAGGIQVLYFDGSMYTLPFACP